MLRKMRKVVDILVTLVFLFFAYVQWNDPDPLIWILVYLSVALIPMSHLLGSASAKYQYLLMMILSIAFVTYIPSITEWMSDEMPSITSEMKAGNLYIELVREALGLLLSIFVTGYYIYRNKV